MKKRLKSNSWKLGNGDLFQVSSLKFRMALLVFALTVVLASCSTKETAHEHADTYICPMHPTVVSDKPSTCPVCGMDLVRKARPGEEVKMTEELNKLIKSPNETVIASIATMKPQFKSMPVELTLHGVVSYDARNTANISARVGGRLEKVFLKYEYQPVSKGQKVAEIYSAELVNAQRELLYLLQADANNASLIEAAKSKLLLLGATANQIETIVQRKEVLYTFPVVSQVTGFIIAASAAAPAAPAPSAMSAPTAGADGMSMGGDGSAGNTASPITPTASNSLIREGSYVTTGQTIFKTVNTNSVWLEFRITADQGNHLSARDNLTTSGGQHLKIDFIEPFSEGGEDFIRIRSYAGGQQWLVGQLVQATIQKNTKESLWLPKDAVTELGINKIVFVKERGQFKPRSVQTGIESNGLIEVRKGLASGDDVAVNAQYLVDSESFVKISN
jgi:biotin carboxyl carrier protein